MKPSADTLPKKLARRLRTHKVRLSKGPNGTWNFSFAIPLSGTGQRSCREAAKSAMELYDYVMLRAFRITNARAASVRDLRSTLNAVRAERALARSAP